MTLKFDSFISGLETLTEAVEGEPLYHNTNITAINHILARDQFELTNGLLNQSDSRMNTLETPYYLATSRNKANRYRSTGSHVTLVLDGRKLKQRYKIKPVDYWGQGFKVLGASEQEERLSSRDQLIHGARKYIKEIHVMYHKDWDEKGWLRQLDAHAQDAGIPVFFYRKDDWKSIYLLDKRKTYEPELNEDEWDSGFREDDASKISDLMDLLEYGKTSNPKVQKRWRNYWERDFITQGLSDLHNFNSEKGPAARLLNKRLIRLMRAEGTSSLEDYLQSRYAAIAKK